MKSPEPENKAQRKVDYILLRDNYEEKLFQKIITENYYQKLSPKIMSENYQLVYQSCRKVEIYRDTDVSKKRNKIDIRYHDDQNHLYFHFSPKPGAIDIGMILVNTKKTETFGKKYFGSYPHTLLER